MRTSPPVAVPLGRPGDGDLIAKRAGRMAFGLHGTSQRCNEVEEGLPPVFISFDEQHAGIPESSWLVQQFPRARLALRAKNQVLLPHHIGRQVPELQPCPLAPVPPAREIFVLFRGQDRHAGPIHAVVQHLLDTFRENRALFAAEPAWAGPGDHLFRRYEARQSICILRSNPRRCRPAAVQPSRHPHNESETSMGSPAITQPCPAGTTDSLADATYRKVGWRLLPLLFLCYIVAYLDRVNVGFAKLQMQSDLQFSEAVYGLGAGIFFLGYFLFEVPSNVVLHRVGARRWIARIMVTWGLLSAGTMFVSSPTSFYAVRFLLGAAEAGFFPGIILYLTYWYPAARRGKATSLFLAAIPFAGILGGPVSGWILQGMGGVNGLAGWQWLFLLQGLPTVALGLVVWRYLDDRVKDARWLTPAERSLIAREIAAEDAGKPEPKVLAVLSNPRVWLLALVYFAFVSGLYGISFWLPSIIKAMGISGALDIGLVSAIPWTFGVVAMYLAARSADRRLEYRWHSAIAAVVGAAGLILSVAFHGNAVWAMAGITLATMGIMATLPVFWGMPTAFLGGAAAAAGIAFINSFGNLSGFSAPYLIGVIKDATQSTDAGLHMLAALLVLGAVLVLFVRPDKPSPTR